MQFHYFLCIIIQVVELDLSTVVSSVSGPKRPHDRVPVQDMKVDFRTCLVNKVNFHCLILVYMCLNVDKKKYILISTSKSSL